MATYRAAISFPVDTTLPVDYMTINPHYGGDDPQALADRLKANLTAFTLVGATKPFTIKIYDALKAPPSYPLASSSQTGTATVSDRPRELALCLSYYSTWNRPQYRGRLFIPAQFIGGTLGPRPAAGQITSALSWRDPLTNGLPAGHNLVIFSRVQQKAYGVTDFWVDDEWDVMRSRGRKPTTRQTAKFP